jgi:FAD:protein FMN transferase
MRHVEHVMGTAVSFDIRQDTPGDPAVAQAVADAVNWLHRVDEMFSTYRHDSPVSRLGRGEISLAECPPEVSEILHLCQEMTDVSHGYFTAYPGGHLDPSAMVKGWAVERASHILIAAGAVNHYINGGGDIQIAGSPAPGRPWRIGIAHPLQPGTFATVVTAEARSASGSSRDAGSSPGGVPYEGSATSTLSFPRATGSRANSASGSDSSPDSGSGTGPPSGSLSSTVGGGVTGRRRLAVATSGTAERGMHILNPRTGRPATDLASITLVGESLTIVDAYATAAFAMGNAAYDWLEQREGLEAFAVTATGGTWQTSDFPNGSASPTS